MISEFHARSAFSFLRGASQPEEMVRRAAELGLRSIAFADHGGFYGSARAHHAALECGIRAIPAATLDIRGAPVPILCATREGYRTLSRHLTNRHLDAIAPHAPLHGGGLIALTGDREGPVMRHLIKDDRSSALRATESLIDLFGRGNVYVEITRHGLRDDGRLTRQLIDLAAHLKLPLLPANAPLHSTRADRLLADAFTCLRHHVPLDQAGLLLAPNGERHLKSPREMARLFADLPQALANVRRLDERLGFTLEKLGYRFPDFPDESGKPMTLPDQTTLLRRRSLEGARKRYGKPGKKILAQMEKEIELIDRLGFSGYFLIVQDIVRFARSQGILCQGRGSAANSVICFVLGITNVDAFHQRLVFERFLSENQRKWPDIDIDFPSGERRESVIQYVFGKYGPRGAAMTANVITYRPRSAFREMSKVLGFPPSLSDRFSTLGGSPHQGSWEDEEREEKQHEFADQLASLVPPSHPRAAALGRLYQAVLGMPRHLGQHSGGIIICDRGLDEIVPIEPATMPGRTVVQWDKDDCEDLGIVKIDLLGLGMLAAMQDAFAICGERGTPIDPARIPLDDPAVYEMLHRADTVGTFQVESRAQMSTLRILRPNHFYEVAIQVAIVRPGPIVGDLLHPYLRRRNGLEPPDFIHPDFKPVLERTMGVPLFQEQVLKMAMLIADFTGGEADDLRRAMAFNRTDDRMRKVTAKLRQRMQARGVDEEVQEKIIHSIGNFALYGFPESHALAFALIAYHSCWLKVHHPAAFYAGLINNQPMGFYSAHSLVQDARHHGIRILPVSCVHSSHETLVIDDRTLRLGLHRLKGISRATLQRLLAERTHRPFSSLPDLIHRVGPNAHERRILAKAGVLNDLPEKLHRREALWQAELPFHDDLLSHPPPARDVSGDGILPPMSLPERLAADLSTQGLSSGPHPMKLWRRQSTMNLVDARTLQSLSHGRPIEIGGLVICRQRPGTAKGHCFISLEDETGISNLFVPKKTFAEFRLVIVSEPFLWATGHVQLSEGNQRTVYVTHIRPLPRADRTHMARSHDFH